MNDCKTCHCGDPRCPLGMIVGWRKKYELASPLTRRRVRGLDRREEPRRLRR